MTRGGSLDKVCGVKDKAVELTKKMTSDLINLLLNDLNHSVDIGDVYMNELSGTEFESEDSKETMGRLVALGFLKLDLLQKILKKTPWFPVNEEGRDIIEFWVRIKAKTQDTRANAK